MKVLWWGSFGNTVLFSWHAAGVYWLGLLCPAHVRWSATDKENERERERENHGTCWHSIAAYVLSGWLPCPQFLVCLSLSESHWFTKHFRSFHRPRTIMHCIMVSHCQPNTIFQQLDLIRNKTIDLLVQCIRPQIRPQKQYLLFMYFSAYFSQIPILIPLNS